MTILIKKSHWQKDFPRFPPNLGQPWTFQPQTATPNLSKNNYSFSSRLRINSNYFLGLKYEDFNVYGIHGAGGESDSPPDGPEDPSFPAGPSQR